MPGAERWTVLLPEVALCGGALVLLGAQAARPAGRGRGLAALGALAVAAAGWLTYAHGGWRGRATEALGGMVVADRFGALVRWVVLGSALAALAASPGYLRAIQVRGGEYYALLLLATAGMTLLAVSADLIMAFVALELLSLALYVMAGCRRDSPASQEAAMKYLLSGAFAAAFLVFGIALLFGAAGTTSLLRLRELVAAAALDDFRLAGLAAVLVMVGLGFKAAMVPFHMWTPDVYQGAPTPVTAFMAAGTKAAAFAALIRIFVDVLGPLRWDWRPPLIGLSVATFVAGSVLAIAQTDVKRMLAYSSIAHAGFVGIGVVAASRTGVAAALLYLAVYAAMTVGAFGCVMLFWDGEGERVHLAKYAGLGTRRPLAAALFALFLFSLAGIPPTGGFFAKLYVFLAAVRAGDAWLAVAGVGASVVAAFFYIRVAVVMFMQPPPAGDEMPLDRSLGLRAALAACAAVVAAVAVAPGFFFGLAARAVSFG